MLLLLMLHGWSIVYIGWCQMVSRCWQIAVLRVHPKLSYAPPSLPGLSQSLGGGGAFLRLDPRIPGGWVCQQPAVLRRNE